MANLTKKAIKESFLKLLEERPINKITVKDIVEGCGINRNSFYYHFQDIPALLEEIVTEDAEKIIALYPTIDSMEQCIDAAIGFAIHHKQSVLHIYNSANRDIFEYYLDKVCCDVVAKYINTVVAERRLGKSDREIIVRFYKCECFGQIIDWMNSGMKNDLREEFHRICELRRGLLESIIERCLSGEIRI